MKKIFTLLLLSFTTIAAFSQEDDFAGNREILSKLSISSITKNKFRVLIDGKIVFGKLNEDGAILTGIRPGYHSIKVLREKNINYEHVRNNDLQVVFEKNIYVKPRYHVDIMINRFGKAFIDDEPFRAIYKDEEDCEDQESMSNSSFQQFKQVICNESFDNTKLAVAKQGISANYLTAAQAREIVKLLTFESTRLELAKYAYQYTTDKKNYFLLNDAFTFSSSRQELARYIQANL